MAIPLQKRLHLGIVQAFWSSLKHDIFDTYRPGCTTCGDRGLSGMPSTQHRPIGARPPNATAAPRQVGLRLAPRAGLWAGAGSANRPDGARAASRYAIHSVPIPPDEDADRKNRTQISRCVGKQPPATAYRLPPVLGLCTAVVVVVGADTVARFGGGGAHLGGGHVGTCLDQGIAVGLAVFRWVTGRSP